MVFCDESGSVVEWSSEELAIPYRSPVDNRIHRYFVDFMVKVVAKDGGTRTMLVEIKPKKQTMEPMMEGKRATKANIGIVKDWLVNNAKWAAAKEYCEDRKWLFKILTEDDIFGKKGART